MLVVPEEGQPLTIRVTPLNVQGKVTYRVEEDGEPHGEHEATNVVGVVTSIVAGFVADTSRGRKRG